MTEHMTHEEFNQIRFEAGLSFAELGELLRVEDLRLIRRWDSGEKPVSGPVSLLMEMVRDGRLAR